MITPSTFSFPLIDGRKRESCFILFFHHFPIIFLPNKPKLTYMHFRKWIEETLQSGYTIVCDRYYYSGMVYSAAKKNPSLNLHWAKSPDVGLPKPDRVIFLDLEPEEAEKRGGYGEEKYEKREMQENVRRIFLDLWFCECDEAKDMEIINAGTSIEEVGEKIWKEVNRRVGEVENGELELKIVKEWEFGAQALKDDGSFELFHQQIGA